MKVCFLFLGFLFLVACKRADAPAEEGFAMRFENPQPINDSELSKIPNKFRGLFMDSDSVYFNITDKMIFQEYYNKSRFHKKELDSIKVFFDLKGDQYISKLNNDVYDYRYIGDSIEFSNKQIDTFFIFSDTQKAKRIDGELVLNYKDSIYWKIKTINVEKNILKIKYIYSEEDFKRMDSLTKIKSTMIDSTLFILKPSRNEFKRILNLKNFGKIREYKKVKNN
ncbi:hypothetical protein [Flavobacterium sp. HJJ]|uniref:hypothetical protein n=1 Tax=Flavobacterium sp. HJJ TaxID=2783792 RepID=UPI00188D375C|nr:hypothetical protein [Flavobacterium sp. HJJ]MBF4469960.1 hypothetical protein [Flavobacterium sp. HJJ]